MTWKAPIKITWYVTEKNIFYIFYTGESSFFLCHKWKDTNNSKIKNNEKKNWKKKSKAEKKKFYAGACLFKFTGVSSTDLEQVNAG